MVLPYSLYDGKPICCFGIVVNVHPLIKGVELLHSIGGYEL